MGIGGGGKHGRETRTALILALATGMEVGEACRKVGVSLTTFYRWRRDPAFQAELDAVRAELVRRAMDRLTDAATQAVQTLLDLLAPTVPPATRLGAARSVLELGLRFREVEDLARRVRALEEAVVAREVPYAEVVGPPPGVRASAS